MIFPLHRGGVGPPHISTRLKCAVLAPPPQGRRTGRGPKVSDPLPHAKPASTALERENAPVAAKASPMCPGCRS